MPRKLPIEQRRVHLVMVRFTAAELAALNATREGRGFPSISDTVRALVVDPKPEALEVVRQALEKIELRLVELAGGAK